LQLQLRLYRTPCKVPLFGKGFQSPWKLARRSIQLLPVLSYYICLIILTAKHVKVKLCGIIQIFIQQSFKLLSWLVFKKGLVKFILEHPSYILLPPIQTVIASRRASKPMICANVNVFLAYVPLLPHHFFSFLSLEWHYLALSKDLSMHLC